jgi:putative LysE/RhtB family amino acid efflux pump
MTALLAGYGLGIGVAAGFGPINVFCLTSGLRHGFWPAWGVGLGAAIVDGFYAVLAGLGAAALVSGAARGWLQLLGGLALLAIAWRMALPRASPGSAGAAGGARLTSTLRLSVGATLANPLTIVSWAAVFAGIVPRLGLSDFETLVPLPLGVAAGTLTWFTIVSAGSALAGRYVSKRVLRLVSAVAAAVIAGFGVWFIVEGLRALV